MLGFAKGVFDGYFVEAERLAQAALNGVAVDGLFNFFTRYGYSYAQRGFIGSRCVGGIYPFKDDGIVKGGRLALEELFDIGLFFDALVLVECVALHEGRGMP